MRDETIPEIIWRHMAEETLIAVYVPDAEGMTHAEALALALERDKEAALTLQDDAESAVFEELTLAVSCS
jgi:hypothetical protein